MGGQSYPTIQDMNNQNYQKSLAEAKDNLHIVLDKLTFLIQEMDNWCKCNSETPPEKKGCSCC